jgi:alkylhydroperoxidase family enzyme
MPRVPLVDDDALEPDDRAALAALEASPTPGAGTDLFRALAQRPALLRTALAHLRALMDDGAVPPDLKALVAVRVAQVNHCVY